MWYSYKLFVGFQVFQLTDEWRKRSKHIRQELASGHRFASFELPLEGATVEETITLQDMINYNHFNLQRELFDPINRLLASLRLHKGDFDDILLLGSAISTPAVLGLFKIYFGGKSMKPGLNHEEYHRAMHEEHARTMLPAPTGTLKLYLHRYRTYTYFTYFTYIDRKWLYNWNELLQQYVIGFKQKTQIQRQSFS